MMTFSSLRVRLVGTVFLAVAPASVAFYFADKYYAAHYGGHLPWTGFAVGLLALAAAWFGGERFILRQVRMLSQAAQDLGAGDLTTRTGLSQEKGELGELAHTFDTMAAHLEQRVKEREQAERTLLNRSFQQAVVGALGQFAMVSEDISALLGQAVMLAAQTLELEYCHVLELAPGGKSFLLRAGVGWKEGWIGKATVPAERQTVSGYALTVGEPVFFEDLAADTRFRACTLLAEHGVVSGMTVAIGGHGQAFGVLGAHTARRRKFTEDEVHFLFSIATVLAMAVARARMEVELRQAQKMESIGQLAAGVAHDFNNMLTVIQGHSGMLLAKSGLPPEMLGSAQAIYFAAERATRLTRQLLMFSRKNVMQPKLLDLREVVSTLSKMLKHVLREPITLEFHPPPEIPLVQGDVGMIEQVIMNLAVNARDAMPNGGTLTISTQPLQITDAYVQAHREARTGAFVCLAVCDTGCGMDSATLNRIFEPFFTTKEAGKGTGLGLATVYGIVKRHQGWIEVTSEVGKGSTFKVFIPASSETVKTALPEAIPTAAVRGGHETILVVEDEPVLRDMAHVILEDCGYTILEAASGLEALQVWEHHPGAIDLVLTDVVMPGGISGRDLAVRLLAEHPKTRVIFTSGYNVEETNTDFFRKGGAVFLQKPYTRLALTKAVRESLDK
jgi:signal transduction histidine kinase/CheY-like chemotaxis protein/HAMP domain-containing protein